MPVRFTEADIKARHLSITGGNSPTVKAAPKKSKYKNVKVFYDEHWFDSSWEAQRYGALKVKQNAGLIQGLRIQVPYDLKINGVSVCKYVADYVYEENGQTVVEDAKGVLTDVFKLKSKLMKAIYGIEIRLTRKRDKRNH